MSGIVDLRKRRDELDAKIAELERAERCEVCDGCGVVRGSAGFANCPFCRDVPPPATRTIAGGRRLIWSERAVALMRDVRREGWGGAVESIWVAGDVLHTILTMLLIR